MHNVCVDVFDFKTKGQVLLMGDFNGRVGNLSDYIPNDKGEHIQKVEDDYSPYLHIRERNFYDSKVNYRGYEIIDLCLSSKSRIINGRVLGDISGKLTFQKWFVDN
jgi:hypothetical protein